MKNNNGVFILEEPIQDKENGYIIDKVDLNKISGCTVSANTELDGILLNNMLTPVLSDNEEDKMKVEYNIEYRDEKVILTGTVFKRNADNFQTDIAIDPSSIVSQIVSKIQENNKKINIATLPTIVSALDVIKDNIYKQAFHNNILLSQEEYNYKINIYKPGTNELIGIANRMFIQHKTLVIMEAISFSNQNSFNKVDMKIIIDKDNAIYIKDLSLDSENGKSIKYCTFNMIDSKIAKINEENDDTRMKLKGIKLPYKNMSTLTMEEQLISANDQNTLIKCYKQNKSMNTVKININKYLLM